MFGISAYAQSPYASLGGSSFVSAIAEGATAADATSSLVALFSSVSETATANDLVYPNVAFVSQISETKIGRAHV